jgi:Tfp pilus assembly protein PilV
MLSSNRRTDEGLTLVEVLIALTILGFAVVTIVGAFAANQRLSQSQRDTTNLQTMLESAAARVNAEPWVSCLDATANPEAAYRLAAQAIPADQIPERWTASGWLPTTNVTLSLKFWSLNNGFTTTCVETASPPNIAARLQLATITISSPAGRSESIEVIKGDPEDPP